MASFTVVTAALIACFLLLLRSTTSSLVDHQNRMGFIRAMEEATQETRNFESLQQRLLDKAQPVTNQFRVLENDGQYQNRLDLQNYALKYTGCQNINTWSDNKAQDEDSDTVFAMERFVVFRMCPAEHCSTHNSHGCNSDYGEYMIPMEDYLAIMAQYHYSRFQEYCSICKSCMAYEQQQVAYQYKEQHENSNFRRRLADQRRLADDDGGVANDDAVGDDAYQNGDDVYQDDDAALNDDAAYNDDAADDDGGAANDDAAGDDAVADDAYQNGDDLYQDDDAAVNDDAVVNDDAAVAAGDDAYNYDDYVVVGDDVVTDDAAATEDEGDDFYAFVDDDFYKDDDSAGGYAGDSCRYASSCYNYEQVCQSYNENDNDFPNYFSCSEFVIGNQAVYLGPHCNGDGHSITLGAFEDDECSDYLGDISNMQQLTGIAFQQNSLSFYYPKTCVSCANQVRVL